MNDTTVMVISALLGTSAFACTTILLIVARRHGRENLVLDVPFREMSEARSAQVMRLRMPWPLGRNRLDMMADRAEAVFASNKMAVRIWGADTLDSSIDMIRFRFTTALPARPGGMRYIADDIALSLGAPGVSIEMDTECMGWIVVPVFWDELAADAVLRLVPHEVRS